MSNSNLDKHLSAKQDKLSSLDQAIKDIQLQLTAITQELRVEQQLAKAQESVAKEFKGNQSISDQTIKRLLLLLRG